VCFDYHSIGWKHGDINILNINEYEQNRDERLTHLDMVLSREEREQLLMYWGVPIQIIAGSTRAASKAKHQRRQTVVNTRKILKLEEVVDAASRKLKRALLITTTSKKQTGTTDENTTDDDRVEEEEEEEEEGIIHVTKDHRAYVDTMIASSRSLDNDNENKQIHVTEPDDDIIGKLDMNVTVSNVASAMMMNNSSETPTSVTRIDASEVDDVYDDDDDDDDDYDDYTLGATTLGNNSTYTTPSLIEIENFYRELELELFGDETELPSFVGQTLEVPLKYTTNALNNKNNNNNGMVMKEDTSSSSHSGTSNSNPQSAFVEKYRSVGHTPVFAADDEYRNCSYNNSPMYYNNTNSAQQQHQQQHQQESNYDNIPTTSTRTRIYQNNNNNNNHIGVGENVYYCHPFPNHPPQAVRYEPTHHSPVDSNINNNRQYHGRSFESAGTNNDLNTHKTQNRSMYGDPDPRRMIPYPRSGIYEPMHNPLNINNSNNCRRRNGSFDDSTYNQTTTDNQFLRQSSSDVSGIQYHHHTQQFRSSSFPIEYSAGNNNTESSSFRRTDADADADAAADHHHHQYKKYDECHSHSQSQYSCFDGGGPQIRHMPLHGHLSPNQWMEGKNSDGERLSYNNATVTTITEGSSSP
jgi:hypothetical protein